MNNLDDLVTTVKDILTPDGDVCDIACERMISLTRQYVKTNNLKSLVVGVSGGLDSAVVASILQEKYTGVPLIGLSMPMNSSNAHREQARWVGENYCSAFEEFDGWEFSPNDFNDDYLYSIIDSRLSGTDYLAKRAGFNNFPTNILQGNMKARLRMITLYDLARKTNGMVLSTDNLSEYLAGFWTLNGDVGDYGIIQNVWKGLELPHIAHFMEVREDIITQNPSDGLGVTEEDTDEAQLGMTYEEFDTIMSIFTGKIPDDSRYDDDIYYQLADQMDKIQDDDGPDSAKINLAIQRHASTNHKRVGTINLGRHDLGLDD